MLVTCVLRVPVAAPSCCAVLADLGATVIKVERQGIGDTWRLDRAHLTPDSAWEGGPHFANNNRGKQSVQLDVKDPLHLAAMKKLISTADVFVTNVRSRALDRAGLGYPALSKQFPSLIYAILTAWGLEGPRADDPGYDVGAFWAATGLQDFSKPADDGHVGQFPPAIGDHLTAMQLVAGVALGLFHRARTGRGQLVDTALLRSGIWGMYAAHRDAPRPPPPSSPPFLLRWQAAAGVLGQRPLSTVLRRGRTVAEPHRHVVTSSRHHVITSSRHQVITSSRRRVVTSSRHHFTTSSRYRGITASHHHGIRVQMVSHTRQHNTDRTPTPPRKCHAHAPHPVRSMCAHHWRCAGPTRCSTQLWRLDRSLCESRAPTTTGQAST